ncbi:thymidylate synthase [Atractiella rhizophila]|nr:thymidylate synthase [Atractiella rhizophila]
MALFEENQYLDLVQRVLEQGQVRDDRTGTGTLSLFAPPQLRFTLSEDHPSNPITNGDALLSSSNGDSNDTGNGGSSPSGYKLLLPLLTTKRVYLHGVAAELLWFLRGETSSLSLASQSVKIWDGNGSRAFLDSRGLKENRDGDLGPVYGFQWRHFGAEYEGPVDQVEGGGKSYQGKNAGYDQIRECVRLIKEDPWSRRIILSAWNPADLHKMALPPCHMFSQFYVSPPSPSSPPNSPRLLSLLLYMRSSDLGLGLPFNISSYALLLHIIAHHCSLRPHELVVQLGDAHIYKNHIEPLKEQTTRKVKEGWPEFRWNVQRDDRENVWDYKEEDWDVIGYKPMKAVKMEMSV